MSAECHEVKAFNGDILTKDGERVWLGMSEGYPACSRHKADALKFKSPDEARKIASRWDGMPWYYRLKPGTLRIFEVTETVTTERSEVAVE